MELEDLLSDSSRKTADIAVDFVGNNPDLFKKVFDFAMLDKNVYAMRAARIIQLVTEKHPDLIDPYLGHIIGCLSDFRNEGLLRSMLLILTKKCSILDEDHMGILTDVCFNLLMNSDSNPAIKVYSMDILYEISKIYPEIKQELGSCIEELLPRSSTGVKTRGSKMLKILYEEDSGDKIDLGY